MGTIKYDPEAPETRTHIVQQKVRLVLAGNERGSVRRIILYVVALVALALAPASEAAAIVGLVALMLLALTDQLA